MIYNTVDIRRQDRLLSEEKAYALKKNEEYGVLSMVSETGSGYGIPINFVFDNHNAIYFHCALDGKKIRCLEKINM